MNSPGDSEADLKALLELLSAKWTLQLLERLAKGPARYRELSAVTQDRISSRTLSDRLHAMSDLGLLERRGTPATPAVRYRPTAKLTKILKAIDCLRESA